MLMLLAALTLAADKPDVPLTLDAIRDVVDAHRSQVKQCYASSPAAKKNLAGKLVVHFVISDQGTVSECSIKEASLADDGVKACVVSAVKSWVFPKPKHGPAAINFPFHFGPPDPKKPAPAEPEPVE
jgi:TonB family protein